MCFATQSVALARQAWAEKGVLMSNHRLPIAALLLGLAVSTGSGQSAAVTPQQASPFVGVWGFTMTEPANFKGSQQTVRIWDQAGKVAASVQVGKFPPINVTGIYRDGHMLVLTISHDAQPAMMENGVRLWAVISLTRDGDGMNMAQMLEHSETIKKGIGKKLEPGAPLAPE
jgi:hypothetical protein